MIDSNAAITGTFTLFQGWQRRAISADNLEKTLDVMKQQGFEQEDFWKGFSIMIWQSSPSMRFRHKGVDVTHSEVAEKEIHKEATWSKMLLGSVITAKAIMKRNRW
jgi:hypothetical protein